MLFSSFWISLFILSYECKTVEWSRLPNSSPIFMIVSDVVVEQKGIGNVSCYASGKITVSTNGIGNVDYFGNPPTTDINKSGIGNVKRR